MRPLMLAFVPSLALDTYLLLLLPSDPVRYQKEKENSQQSKRDITLQSRLQLNLDIQVEPQLQPHGLGIRETREDSGRSQAAATGSADSRGECSVVIPIATTTAAAGAD